MKNIDVATGVVEKTPELIRALPKGQYSLTKVGNKENPVHGTSRIPLGSPYVGSLSVVDRAGGPALCIGGYPWSGMITSWVLGAKEVADGVEVSTENSIYLLTAAPKLEASNEDIQ